MYEIKTASQRAIQAFLPNGNHIFKADGDNSIISLPEWRAAGCPHVWKLEASRAGKFPGEKFEVWVDQGHGYSVSIFNGAIGDWSSPGSPEYYLQAGNFVAFNTGVGWRLFEEVEEAGD